MSNAAQKGPSLPETMSLAESGQVLEEYTVTLRATLEELRFQQDLDRRTNRRLSSEIEKLTSRIHEMESDRRSLLALLEERDRLVAVIFASRSWRAMQALRRLLGRR